MVGERERGRWKGGIYYYSLCVCDYCVPSCLILPKKHAIVATWRRFGKLERPKAIGTQHITPPVHGILVSLTSWYYTRLQHVNIGFVSYAQRLDRLSGCWGELICTLVPWRQGFRHPIMNECVGWFAQIIVWIVYNINDFIIIYICNRKL